MSDIVDNLRTTAAMMNLGERFSWGSDTALMEEAAETITSLRREVEEARGKALEEAAAIADDYECSLADYGGSVDAQHFYEGGMLDAGVGIAAAIRALQQPAPGDGG